MKKTAHRIAMVVKVGCISTLLSSLQITASGQTSQSQTSMVQTDSVQANDPYKEGAGFNVVKSKYGSVNFKIYTYLRYLNQKYSKADYTYANGNMIDIDRRQDMQVNKVNLQFLGWFMDQKLRYIFYTWTNNTAQGQSAQVVVGGNLQYIFNDHLTIGGGINSLPGTRSTEGTFPHWLSNDNRSIADEFFRPSYTTGIFVKGNIVKGLTYNAMLGNNLSQLGVDAGQLDDQFNTVSITTAWCPTTGEFGKNAGFGDFEKHEKIATRLGAKFSRSREDRQGVPSSEAFENVTIRLSDGTVIFAPDALAAGTQLDKATYMMYGFDAGVKFNGFSLESEFYFRDVSDFTGTGVENIGFNRLTDNGYQLLASGMIIDRKLQLYGMYSAINGEYGDPYDVRAGLNWFPWKMRSVKLNAEYMYAHNSPVGGLSLPYFVGSNGTIYRIDLIIDF
ncbi:MAG TPA: hypothetical protein VFW78_03870 [Bacteroidia bacterium]|nr:hypothetical protein [Bacteroidia bacterium]